MSNEAQPGSALFQGATVADQLVAAISRYPERKAFVSDEAVVSYRELGEWISRLAQFFDSLGLKPGDTVAQLGVNRFEVFAVIAAVYLRGLRSVTLHALGSEDDHRYVLDDSGADLVIADAYHGARAGVLRERCTGVRHWISLGALPGFQTLESSIAAFTPQPLASTGQAEDIVRLAYTGGTTGRPKGVMLSNRALVSNALLDLAAKEWPEQVRYLCAAPISHGAGSLVVPCLMQGGSVTLLRAFSVDGFIDTVKRHDCNVTWLVPTMLYGILDSSRHAEVDWSRFHALVYSGAPASPARIRQALATLGPILIQSYGQTEAPNNLLILGRAEHAQLTDAQLASAGRPYPQVRLALLDENNQPVADGQVGEICVRGPLLMSGYLNKPEETASALAGDWLHTGDVAYRDADGLYYIVDRKKDLIISGGFNVYPKEVEDAICAQPGVAAAAVIGVPDPKWGEMVMAYVQPRPGSVLSVDAIAEGVRQAKGAVATPKRVEFLPALPLTALGKVDKKALRALHWAAGERAVN
ncbi:AMP-binding protein [Pseudorhodoferax sp.]|uniref:AMP-binding protein n=1 Tax=Pseudorhodoferax sp. TaxID=1993553 RepID=UPI002DD693D6|nr:AMP-binding protein [Pseudorhodoferax sp.]